MSPPLFLQTPTPTRPELIGRFFETFWPLLVPVVLGLIGVYLLLPRARRYPPLWGGVAAGLALATGAWILIRSETALPETILFYAFSGLAVVAGGLLITLRNPVHAALSFALVVLSTCGLFLLQAAPFLMAATIIIYAGAIVVTFLFVIMLAQQEGASNADQRSREPFLTTVAGFILLGALLCVLYRTYDTATLDDLLARADRAAAAASPEEVAKALGGSKEFTDAFSAVLRNSPKGPSAVTYPMAKGQLYDAVIELDQELANKTPDMNAIKQQLRDIHNFGAAFRAGQGSLVAEERDKMGKKIPRSPFSGAPASASPPLTPDGKVTERMPANNVSALGRSLFSDYLLADELGGVLLLVATIGAVAIAGRRTEGLR